MQIFIPYKEPIRVAECLDGRRLNKQVIEAKQIYDAVRGTGKGWFNHPIVHMYKNDAQWLRFYRKTLQHYKMYLDSGDPNHLGYARGYSERADAIRPAFISDDLCDQHKRRLYTKDPEHYKQFESFGTSEENWYVVDGEIFKYKFGKIKK